MSACRGALPLSSHTLPPFLILVFPLVYQLDKQDIRSQQAGHQEICIAQVREHNQYDL
mgnify:CR=1 FL=1